MDANRGQARCRRLALRGLFAKALTVIAAVSLVGCENDASKSASAGEQSPDAASAGKPDSKGVSPATENAKAGQPNSTSKPAKEHPFAPPIRRAEQVLKRLEKVKDYTAVMCKRELIGDRLGVHQYIAVKIRNRPLSVYMKFLAPAEIKGREVIYVEGQNDGKLIAHPGRDEPIAKGILGVFANKTTRLDPREPLFAMRGNRYPITEIGLLNLIQRLVEVGREDMQRGEATVRYFNDAKINGRPAPAMEFVHPLQRDYFRFHVARVFIDQELQVPTRYAAYKWPARPGDPPVLMEEYTYLKIKLDVGLRDRDFDPTNPGYSFPAEKK